MHVGHKEDMNYGLIFNDKLFYDFIFDALVELNNVYAKNEGEKRGQISETIMQHEN